VALIDINIPNFTLLPIEAHLDVPDILALDINCFLAGTLVATPNGEVPIETLKTGDLVTTDGGVAAPVRWLARQTISRTFADPMRVMPIRIKADALGEHLPARDLFVSPDHALLVDGALIEASALVNGDSIVRHDDVPETFTYYHVELSDHSLILVEGVPAETFLDHASRLRFDNWDERPVEAAPARELDYPRAKAYRQVTPATRQRLLERAVAMRDGKVADAA
jgi:hypothetical protein